jgi:hypothetical protein
VVLSGSCYPLVSVGDLQDELAIWRGLSRLQLDPIPYARWSRGSLIRDGGRHRFDRRFLTAGGRVILVGGYPIPTGRRAIPDGLLLHASSQWKIYARGHAQTLLRVLDERPDLVRFWSSTFVPQESCPASILASPLLTGSVAEELRDGLPWYVDWRGSKDGHPRWLALDRYRRCLTHATKHRCGPTILRRAASLHVGCSRARWAQPVRSCSTALTSSSASESWAGRSLAVAIRLRTCARHVVTLRVTTRAGCGIGRGCV